MYKVCRYSGQKVLRTKMDKRVTSETMNHMSVRDVVEKFDPMEE
jgi:hypothetical protein